MAQSTLHRHIMEALQKKVEELEVELKKRLILVVFLVLLFGVGAMVYWGQRAERLAELYYSGTIEATQANLAFQVNGRVRDVFFDEGQVVEKKQLLAELEQEEFNARRDRAQSDLMRSQAGQKQLETLLELNRKVLPAEVDLSTEAPAAPQ